MKRKEIFWAGLKGGLFEEKHYRAMGEAVWLFGWLTTRQTGINDAGEGIVSYGNPMTREQIAADTGYNILNVKAWTARLVASRYVRTVPAGKLGNTFFICKGKQKARNPKPTTQYFPAYLNPDGHYSVRQNEAPGQYSVRTRTAKCPANSPNSLENQTVAPITNTLTPTHLNYNTEARPSSLLKATAKKLQPPRQMSQADLDARRRELLQQREAIMKKYPPKAQPGKVAVMPERITA